MLLFRDILLICEEMELLDGTKFSLDGLKLSSNASKERSGTKSDLKKKKEKIEKWLLKNEGKQGKRGKEVQLEEGLNISWQRDKNGLKGLVKG